jgi:CRP-like cAMP-binding protein
MPLTYSRDPQRESLRTLLEELYQERSLWHYRAGRAIPLCRDDVWIIYRGIVQVQTLHPSGDESIINLIGPMMPLAQKFTTLESYDTYALSDVDLLRLRWKDIQESPRLSIEMNQLLALRLRQTESLLALLGRRHIGDRLVGFLGFLAREFGQQTPDGIFIDIHLTHQQIANVLGATRVTVTRFLGILRQASLFRVGEDRRWYVSPQILDSNLDLRDFGFL